VRPEVAAQLIREYIYQYGAVSPKDGTCVYLIMPTSNTASCQAFLDAMARRFTRQDILLALDGAPNHRCRNLAVPDNIMLLYLPPYSPELNPKENLWDEIREKLFKNYALKSAHAPAQRQRQQDHVLQGYVPAAVLVRAGAAPQASVGLVDRGSGCPLYRRAPG
jgi:DDE superfamily endonuclease